MHLGKLRIKGRHILKDVSFDFAGFNGITVIHGLNKNDGGSRSTNSNASGKSAMFATVKDTLFPEVIFGSKKDRAVDGTVWQEVIRGKDRYVVKAKGKRIRISKNGEPLDIHKIASVNKALEKITGISLTTFCSLYYLDKLSPHPVALGTSKQRKEFFTEFFDLDGTTDLKKQVALELAEVRATSKLVASQKAQLERLLAEQAEQPKDVRELKDRLDALRNRQADLKIEVANYTKQAPLRDFLHSHSKDLLRLQQFGITPDSLDEARAELKTIVSNIRIHEQCAQYSAELSAYKKHRAKVREWYVSRGIKRADLQDLIATAEKAIKVIESAQAGAEREYAKVVRAFDAKTDELEAAKLKAKRVLKDLQNNTEKVCPTCGKELDDDKHNKSTSKEHNVRKAQVKLDQATELLRAHKETAVPPTEEPEMSPKVRTRLSKHRADLRMWQTEAPELDEAPEEPNNISSGVLAKTNLDDLRKEEEKIRDRISRYSLLENPLAIRALKMPPKLRKSLIEDATDPTGAYLKISDRIADLEVAISQAKVRNKQIMELQTELAAGQEILDTAEALKVLDKAYGANGIRHYRIQAIANRLAVTMNRYSKLMYAEEYKFSASLDKEFSIRAERNNGKESDVRRLSGAEQSLFQCLLWCSLMALTPKASRPNFVLLDEMDAPLSSANLDRFLNALPIMLKLVPHVIIVTPKSEVNYSNLGVPVRYLTMVKDGASSSLQSLRK